MFPAVAVERSGLERDPSESKLVHTLSGVFRDCPREAEPTQVMSLVSNFSVRREEVVGSYLFEH